MFDLHTHTLLSDGEMLPSELARRFEAKGFKAIAITDHVDASNIKNVVPAIVNFCKSWPKKRIKVIPGIELTHIPLEHFKPLTKYARRMGIRVILAHGETVCEPVIKGTNRKALSSDIDILAHPGLISERDVVLAKNRKILLEITCRCGHSKTNHHVARLAKRVGARLVLNSDGHCPADIKDFREYIKVGLKSGLNRAHLDTILKDTSKFIDKIR